MINKTYRLELGNTKIIRANDYPKMFQVRIHVNLRKDLNFSYKRVLPEVHFVMGRYGNRLQSEQQTSTGNDQVMIVHAQPSPHRLLQSLLPLPSDSQISRLYHIYNI